MTWHQIDRDELLNITGGDPFPRLVTGPDVVAVANGQHPGSWGLLTPWRPGSTHWGGLAVATSPNGAAAVDPTVESGALEALLSLAPEVTLEWFSTAPGRALTAPAGYTEQGSGVWAFMSTDNEPVTDARVVDSLGFTPVISELDDQRDASFLQAAGERLSHGSYAGFPGRGYASNWLALRDDSGDAADPASVRALGAIHLLGSGVPHLGGIVVDPLLRGRGVGAWLTGMLTARAIRDTGVSTLGVDEGNDTAERLYTRLGYHVGRRLHTRSFVAD